MITSKMNIPGFKNISAGLGAGCLLLVLASCAQAAPLTAGDPIPLPGTSDGFDFIRVDAAADRLLLGHEGNKSFDVFDITTKKLLKVVPTSTAQDATTDVKRGCYYVAGNDPARLVIVDSTKLEITGEVPVPTNVDLISFNPVTGLVYLCNDTAGEIWVIDPAAKKLVTTIKVDGSGVEDLAFDADYQHLYQAVKGKNTIAVIDPASNKVLAAWPCAPDKGVHGIAVVPEANGLLVACAGKLVLFDRTTGKVTATAVTGGRVDEMAYDPGLHIAYCASRQGKISCVAVAAGKLTPLGDVPDEAGTGDIAVDPKTHTVWIAFKKGGDCFAQAFTPAK
ncbi:MAG: YncE family protein [Verrucomicrobiae bacterium]|nr:YncE family protein [Verrucomicrobiae bacterium]